MFAKKRPKPHLGSVLSVEIVSLPYCAAVDRSASISLDEAQHLGRHMLLRPAKDLNTLVRYRLPSF